MNISPLFNNQDVARFFVDSEFVDDGSDGRIHLLSLAIVAETQPTGWDPRFAEFYAETDLAIDYKRNRAPDQWIQDNVVPHLVRGGDPILKLKDCHGPTLDSRSQDLVMGFLQRRAMGKRIELWGYYSAYDWVAFCQLFGKMVEIPDDLPKYCVDLKQVAKFMGVAELAPNDGPTPHHALQDARWIRDQFLALKSFAEGRAPACFFSKEAHTAAAERPKRRRRVDI